jgi:hypothetical protein
MQADDIKKFPGEDCSVAEDMFPFAGKCCHKSSTLFAAVHVSDCPYCCISTSHPYGTSMKTVTIFECVRLGYGRRITE